ncbi:hypothetical protein N8H74_27080 [Pseudomonas sp. B2M1-30]|uniref:Lipoprotein n=1 Tax=Pseudomonas koreensis TaxID=198620 RepID=A0A9X2XLX4_9PSED|nr:MULTISPECIES: hypothetical protein [Pseudomonas]MCU0121939.1 hypothetical protein [Pseudomonas sp. B2M1-30]MCU7251310.1 hypothetical protein [Pseudomonas koreensis]MCU7264060.1 hypothetical protein [Pseudomonas koreensis]
MNRFLLGIAVLILGGGLAHADGASPSSALLLAQSPTGNSNNPYNSPIRRANPNSMQGTQPSAPTIRGPNTVPVPRPPTLDNRGIGNGQPQRSVPSTPPTFIPNPPSRSTDSNR